LLFEINQHCLLNFETFKFKNCTLENDVVYLTAKLIYLLFLKPQRSRIAWPRRHWPHNKSRVFQKETARGFKI